MKRTPRNARRRLLWLLSLAAASIACASQADELRVEGRVVRVEPLTTTRPVAEPGATCTGMPPPADDLVALLSWDLRSDCTPEQGPGSVATGYRVYYEWDGRLYHRVMRKPPGDTVALKVRID
ncbi:MAG: hypothetical protein R3E86_03500 [Pseudomonadales bacterium]